MRRRRLLTATAAVTPLTGCVFGYQGRGPLAAGGPQAGPVGDDELPVPKAELRPAAPWDAIPAITAPAFAPDWSAVSIERDGEPYQPRLNPAELVVGVERGGASRAYPLSVLTWHEVVNDEFDGPLLVTYCPLCRSGVVAHRTVSGQVTTFGVSGYLYRENLVMYDRLTESLWSQLGARAIRGPMTGANLSLLPASVTNWAAWQEAHPDTRVLLPSPLSETVLGAVHPPYGIDYYGRKAETEGAFGLGGPSAGTLPDRMLVIGIEHRGLARAYPFPDVHTQGAVNDRLGDLPVVVTVAGGELHAFVRRVDGRTLAFEAEPFRAGGSRFDPLTGRAVDGPLAGSTLEPAPGARTLYWFAWKAFHPDTDVHRD